jgi:hypothetical protein
MAVSCALSDCREAASYLAAADEDGCRIVGQVRTSAETPDISDEAVDAGPRMLKVFDEAILAILFLCVFRGFGDAVGIEQKVGSSSERDGALWVRGHPEAKRQAGV